MTLPTLNKIIIKCTVHYIVHLQCTFSLSLVLMKVRDSDVLAYPQETIEQWKNTILYLYCTVSRTVSRDDRTIQIMFFHQNDAWAIKNVLLLHILQWKSYVRTCTYPVITKFGLLYFTMLRPVLAWRPVWNL
jgi:hypothetical protein